jgi:hypothetical protein
MKRRISSQFCVTTTDSSLSVALPGFQAAKRGGVAGSFFTTCTASVAARCPSTRASNSELEARRLAPCRPVIATSPAA